MPDEVFGMSREGARRTAEVNRRVLGQRVETGRRTRRVYPPGGGGGTKIIAFEILEADCEAGTATATVIAVSCPNGTGVNVGDEVDLLDFLGCFLDGNEALLVARKGYASSMTTDTPETAEEDRVGCEWYIFSICCPTETC
jgi:hypothetical protein